MDYSLLNEQSMEMDEDDFYEDTFDEVAEPNLKPGP